MKKTSASYNKNKDTLKTIIFYIILIVIDVFSIRTLYYDLNTYEELNEEIVFLIIILTIIIVGKIIGLCKGWLYKAFNEVRTSKNDKYLRELPNDFGIGVTTLLFDSKIENRKDIVAVILDLCARKYLSLTKSNDKYIIKILKKIDKNLLDNEKYIMELLMNNNIKNIDYYKWYGLCEQDGINLGLYNRYQGEIYDDYKVPDFGNDKISKVLKIISKIIAIIIGILCLFYFLVKNLLWGLLIGTILSIVIIVIVYYVIAILLLGFYGIMEMIKALLIFFHIIGEAAVEISYNKEMSNNLMRTKYGEKEYQKLVSFRNFIKDFGAFADREAKEIVIWDRYLSYAQVFGLTKEIMQTGYKELVNNASFHIDNIDTINLDNIEVLNVR